MDKSIIIAVIASLGTIFSPIIQIIFRVDPRTSIERDLKIIEQLPEDSEARKSLEHDVQTRVSKLPYGTSGSRNGIGVFLAVFLGGASLYGAIFTASKGWSIQGWGRLWWMAALFLLIVAVLCFQQVPKEWVKVPRDSKGNRVE